MREMGIVAIGKTPLRYCWRIGFSSSIHRFISAQFEQQVAIRQQYHYVVKGDELKKMTDPGKMCLCQKVRQSQWNRRRYFARMRSVPQEAKKGWARW